MWSVRKWDYENNACQDEWKNFAKFPSSRTNKMWKKLLIVLFLIIFFSDGSFRMNSHQNKLPVSIIENFKIIDWRSKNKQTLLRQLSTCWQVNKELSLVHKFNEQIETLVEKTKNIRKIKVCYFLTQRCLFVIVASLNQFSFSSQLLLECWCHVILTISLLLSIKHYITLNHMCLLCLIKSIFFISSNFTKKTC